MSDRDALSEIITSLKQQRDELKLHMHLAGAEAKQEYDRLSAKITELTDQYEPARQAAGETATNVFAALKLAAEEMKAGFERIASSLKSE